MSAGFGLGVIIGIGVAIVGRKVARPFLKGMIQAGIITSQALIETFEEARETVSDLLSEVQQTSAVEGAVAEASRMHEARRKTSSSN